MAAVKDRHIVFLSHSIDGIEKRKEILLRVDIFLPVGRQKDVSSLLKSETLMNIGGLDVRKILVKDLRHRRTGHVCPFLRYTGSIQIAACVLRVTDIHIRNDIDYTAVRLLRETFVEAAVTGLHMEDRDMQTLSSYHGKTGIRISEHKHSIRLCLDHKLVGGVDDIAHSSSQVFTDCVHIDLRISQFEIPEEYTVKIIVIVLTGMGQNTIEVFSTFVDNCCKANYFRPCANNYKEFKTTVVLKLDVAVISFQFHIILLVRNRYRVWKDRKARSPT